MIDITDTPHGLHLDMPGSPGLTISSDEVAAIVQHGADDPVTCGWKSAVLDVQAALDGADS